MTGAQQDDATPEKTPRAKTPAVSLRSTEGEWMNDGMLQDLPIKASMASASIRTPPAAYSGVWKRRSVVITMPTPRVTGSNTTARPSANTNVSGSSFHRRFLTADER